MEKVLAKKMISSMLSAVVVAASVLPGLAGAAGTAGTAGESKGFELRILHTNDTHAHLDQVARRVTAVNAARNDSTLLLDAGDVFSGTLYFNQYNGLADLYFMNLLGYDAMVLGNHEFDKGPKVLADFVKQAKFPLLSANIDFSTEPALQKESDQAIGVPASNGKIYPAMIKEVNGEKVGIIGLTTPDTAVLSSPGQNIKFQDEVESAQQQVDAFEEMGIEMIIALTHLGYNADVALAEQVKGLDIIVGGHSHTILNEPKVVHADEEPTLIVQTGEYDNNLGQLDVTFNDEGVVTAWKGQLIPLNKKDDAGNYTIASDPAAAEKLAEYAKALEELKKTVVGKSGVELNGERESVRKEETNLGNLMADGMRSKVMSIVKDPDAKAYVTIQNSGGIRASIGAGDITLGHLLTTMPYGNNLTALKMTGEEIVAALENGVSGVEDGAGRFPQVSGLRFYYDSTKQPEKVDSVTGTTEQEGQRIASVQILNEDGTYSDIDPDAYYIVATNSYVADGGDFYSSMKQAKEDGRLYELNLVDYEVFREHLDQVGNVKISTEGRITDLLGAALPAEAGGNAGATNGPVFKDIVNDPALAMIQEAAEAGIIKGYEDGTFRPDRVVTRAEFAVLISRAFDMKKAGNAAEFTDAHLIPAWAQDSIAALDGAGLLKAWPGMAFKPMEPMTASEAATLLRAISDSYDVTGEAKSLTRKAAVLLIMEAL
ncbi:5'-Nucleotidase domain-containing protein [Paenibacillus algicola]|uniref:5'-Nucleotidase domain-containing protein n=1 Tax=Paenibacillus algicola TaxID=2565926 RepID=A0A4P8XMD9_9BACL|nr:5'-nucleotidase C-terminal domain-containing protein [Paenibacillus algicola]QCT01419.1 5'-Nucleotidase domain-containing protein [Paenibacillus algicola]